MSRTGLSKLTIAWAAAGMAAAVAVAQPQMTFEAAGLTHYLDRGELIGDDPVLQAQIDVDVNGLTFNIWGNVDLTDANDRLLEVTETQLSLGYGFELHPLNLAVGVTQYLFPDQEGTREVFAHAALAAPLNPAVGIYYDFDRVEGAYIDAGIHYEARLAASTALEMRVALGYGDSASNLEDFDYAQAALRDLTLSATLRSELDRRTIVSAGAVYWLLADADLREHVEDNGGLIFKVAVQRRF